MGALKTKLPDKYAFRREQILHYIIMSGEISNDLYKIIGITYTNYRNYLRLLRQDEIIRTNKNDGITGYVLTAQGKRMVISDIRFQKYGGRLVTTTNQIQKRRRMQNFAELYAAFDLCNVTYEYYNKPDISRFKEEQIKNKLYFYTSTEFKKELEKSEALIRGSRSYGILIMNNEAIPVYKARYNLPEFTNREFSFIMLLKKYFNSNLNKAVMFCDDFNACGNISKSIMNFAQVGKCTDITGVGYYRNLILIPTREHIELQMWTLYNEEHIVNKLNVQLKVQKKHTYIVCDGFIGEEPVLYMLNFDIAKLNPFLSYNKQQQTQAYIVCYDYVSDVINNLLYPENNIKIIRVKSSSLERRCSSNEV